MSVPTLTITDLRKFAPRGDADILQGIVEHQELLGQFGVTTCKRFQHLMAQIGQASAGFRTTVEYASRKAYEGRKDLGNTEPGDGVRFRGGGLIQLTGRYNVTEASEDLGVDYVNNPRLLREFPGALLAALWYC